MSEGTDPDNVIEDFLGGDPRAKQLREMRETLETRLRLALAERDSVPADEGPRIALDRKIRELKEQVRVLAEEEAVTQFVEDSVRASLYRPRHPGEIGDDDEEGY